MPAALIAPAAPRLLLTVHTGLREPWLAAGGGSYSSELPLLGPNPSGFRASRFGGGWVSLLYPRGIWDEMNLRVSAAPVSPVPALLLTGPRLRVFQKTRAPWWRKTYYHLFLHGDLFWCSFNNILLCVVPTMREAMEGEAGRGWF